MKIAEFFIYVILTVAFIGFVLVICFLFKGSTNITKLTDLDRTAVEITDNLMTSNLTATYGVFNYTKIMELDKKNWELFRNCRYSAAVRFTFLLDVNMPDVQVASSCVYGDLNYDVIHFGYFGPNVDKNKLSQNPSENGMCKLESGTERTAKNEIVVPVVLPSGKTTAARLTVVIFDDFLSRVSCAVQQAYELDGAATFLTQDDKSRMMLAPVEIDNDVNIHADDGQLCIDTGGISYCRQLPAGVRLAGSLEISRSYARDTKNLWVAASKAGDSVRIEMKQITDKKDYGYGYG